MRNFTVATANGCIKINTGVRVIELPFRDMKLADVRATSLYNSKVRYLLCLWNTYKIATVKLWGRVV
jgi:hypothetical protein